MIARTLNGPAQVLDLVGLPPLMALTSGAPQVRVALVDGPVAMDHPGLETAGLLALPADRPVACASPASPACVHGTFVAGMLKARRGAPAPAICPDCTLLLRPVFGEAGVAVSGDLPTASPTDLAAAIDDCVRGGARIISLSLALAGPAAAGVLRPALDLAARRGVLIVAAVGNQGAVGGSAITSHPGVIPVTSCDLGGAPLGSSNQAVSAGRHGLSAPGAGVTSLLAGGGSIVLGGTSVAAPFVTGAIALLWSAFPSASPAEIRFAVTQASARRRTSLVPPVLNAWAAYQLMARL